MLDVLSTGAQAFPVESQAIDFHDRPCLQPQFTVIQSR